MLYKIPLLVTLTPEMLLQDPATGAVTGDPAVSDEDEEVEGESLSSALENSVVK